MPDTAIVPHRDILEATLARLFQSRDRTPNDGGHRCVRVFLGAFKMQSQGNTP